MCRSAAPPSWVQEEPSRHAAEPVISRELLRRVCEPFFEEMLTALQLSLQQQQQQQQQQHQQQQQRQQQPQQHLQHLQLQQLAAVTKDNCFQAVFHQRTHLDPMPDDESTTDEVGAFASLLSGPPSSPEEAETNVADVQPLAQNLAPTEEKSIMVCRHWRNKGCCRMEDKCKFLHPENKRGVTASKPSTASSAGGAGASTTLSLSSMIAPVVEAALPRRRKRGGRDKSSREQQAPQDSPCSSND